MCKNVTVASDADRLKQQRKQQGFTQCQRRSHLGMLSAVHLFCTV